MVKPPRAKHSRTRKEPVTIELEAKDVERAKADTTKSDTEKGETAPTGAAKADTAPQASAAKPSPPSPGAESQPDPEGKPSTETEKVGSTGTAGPDTTMKSGPKDTGSPASPRSPQNPPEPPKRETAAGSATGPKTRTGVPPLSGASPQAARPSAGPPPATDKPRGGAAGLAAGATGGLVVFALMVALLWSGMLPVPAPEGEDANIAALQNEVAELRDALSAIGAPVDADEVDARISAAVDEAIASMRTELDTLESRIADAGGAAPDFGPIETRIDELESAIASLGDTSDPEAAATEIAGQLTAFDERLTSLEAAGDQAPDLTGRLEALESELGAMAQDLGERAEGPRAALVIAASSLKAAIDRGDPFSVELETYAALSPGTDGIAELGEYASSGVATRSEIASEVSDAADRMVAAARPRAEGDGFWDRLWESGRDLVTVRPVGIVEGESVEAIVARLEVAIRAGDYERAIAEFDQLPPAAQAAGENFMSKVRARHGADMLAERALSEALRAT
jgi:hypothetical protein